MRVNACALFYHGSDLCTSQTDAHACIRLYVRARESMSVNIWQYDMFTGQAITVWHTYLCTLISVYQMQCACVCMCITKHMHLHIHTHTYVQYIHTYIHTHIRTQDIKCMHAYILTCTHRYTRMHTYTHAYMHTHTLDMKRILHRH